MSLDIFNPSHGGYRVAKHCVDLSIKTDPSSAPHTKQRQTSVQIKDEALPAEQRQHPRRTASNGTGKTPSLICQDERKQVFVNDLVDSATHMVEIIWPLSTIPCSQKNSGRAVLPLRRYIEETLRRSRTSYSTLQVALYYLVLIKPHVPAYDFSRDQISSASRALQCGRRMFLAALILASKYLQDRNYSAKAWSKMSGLNITEINTNERIFLQAVQWQLHIPEATFKKWTEIVLQYTCPQTTSPGCPAAQAKANWKRVIPLLTPSLDHSFSAMPFSNTTRSMVTSSAVEVSMPSPVSTHPSPTLSKDELSLRQGGPATPALARNALLPTPSLTPTSAASNTPAASVYSAPHMSSAIAEVRNNDFCRIALDSLSCSSRDSSLAPSFISTGSSPESMISDATRSSRSCSISSVSTAPTSAPSRGCTVGIVDDQSVKQPIVIDLNACESLPIEIIDLSAVEGPSPRSVEAFKSSEDVSIIHVSDLKPASRKRLRSQRTSVVDASLPSEVRELLDQDREELAIVGTSGVPLTKGSRRSQRTTSSVSQAPVALRRSNAIVVPISVASGKKRMCCHVDLTAETVTV